MDKLRRYKLFFVLSTILIIVVAALILVSNLFLARLIERKLESDLSGLMKNIYSRIDAQAKDNLYGAMYFSNFPELDKVYAISDEKAARQELRKIYYPQEHQFLNFLNLDKIKVHYTKIPTKSLLRTWRMEGEVGQGDDLSLSRESISYVYQTRQPLTGMELGHGGVLVRGIVPILRGDRYLGSVEMSTDLIDVLQPLIKSRKFGIFGVNKYIRIVDVSEIKFMPDLPFAGYRFFYYTDETIANLVNLDQVNAGLTHVVHYKKGRQFVSLFPLKDFRGKIFGVGELVSDMAKDVHGFWVAVMIRMMLIFLIVCFCLYILWDFLKINSGVKKY